MGGVVIVVPVDTIVGRVGDVWSNWPPPEDIACNSGVLIMISEARLISEDLIGKEALWGGEKTCFSGDADRNGAARDVVPVTGGPG